MKKIMTLIKVSLNHDMNIFRINTKKQSKLKKILVPLALVFYLMFLMGMYSYKLMEMLVPLHLEFAVLTFFGIAVSFITLLEGIYKSGSLLFIDKSNPCIPSLLTVTACPSFTVIDEYQFLNGSDDDVIVVSPVVLRGLMLSDAWAKPECISPTDPATTTLPSTLRR